MRARALASVLAVAACSSGSPSSPGDSGASSAARVDAQHDGTAHREAGRDRAPTDARALDAKGDATTDATIDASDAAVPTSALVRLANWSPDAPGIDFCVAPHGTSLWSGPVLAAALGKGAVGTLVVTDAGLPVDAGAHSHKDAGGEGGLRRDASGDAADASRGDAGRDAGDAGEGGAKDAAATGHDATDGSERVDASGSQRDGSHEASDAAITGVLFPRVSPYVSIAPGEYDVRVVTAGSTGCGSPLFADVDDLPALRAGAVDTLAAVGDTVDQGTDPGLTLSVLPDDTAVPMGEAALRFVNAVPSVIEVTFASGQVSVGSAVAYVSAAQFASAGVDADGGRVDSNDYVLLPPVKPAQVWSLIDANGGTQTLVTVNGVALPAGDLATVVAIGGESGASQYDIGILVCTDTPPIVAGETAACQLLEEGTLPVCGCPACGC